MTYETRVTQISEMATEVTIVDEFVLPKTEPLLSGGEYVEVKQTGRTDLGKIVINPEEWPVLKAAIDTLIAECRGEK